VAKTRKLIVDVLADASKVTSEFGKIGKSSGTLEDKFKKLGKSLALGMGAAAAGAVVLGKGAIDAAVDAQKVQKGVEASIRSSGGAANVTAKEIDKFASAMQFKTGIDDEAIKTSQTLLLGFRNVRNESGDGNKIFNRASVAMLDLGKKMGSTDAAAKALGRALTDPIGGLKGLKGAGVALTAQQKEQVKGFVASGDLLSAQKIVLDEVTKATGGYAESTTTAGDRAKLAFGELQEKIGGGLLPIAEKLSTWFVDTLIPAVQTFWTEHGPKIVKTFKDFGDKLKKVADVLGPIVLKALKELGKFIKDNGTAIATGLGLIATALGVYAVSAGLAAVASGILAAGIVALEVVSAPAWGTVLAGSAAILGLIAALTFAGDLFPLVGGALSSWIDLVKQIPNAVRRIWSAIVPSINGAIGAIEMLINSSIDGMNRLLEMLNLLKPGKDFKKWDHVTLGRFKETVIIDHAPTEVVGNKKNATTFGPGMIPGLAAGGVVNSPTLAMIGEAGPEAVIPLSRLNTGGNTYQITVNASPLSSPADVGSAVVDALKAYERRNGSLPLKVA